MKIHAPKNPKKENPKVTIALQGKQINLLIDRCAKLEAERDLYQGHSEQASLLAQSLSDLQREYSRLQGWQTCAREMFGISMTLEPFPSNTMGP